MAARVLVEADRDAEVVGTRLDDRCGQGERAAGRRAPVVHVDELDAGEAELRDELVGLDRLLRAGQGSRQAAAERELHVGPLDPGVAQRLAYRERPHVQARHSLEAAERVHSDADDGDVHFRHHLQRRARRAPRRPV